MQHLIFLMIKIFVAFKNNASDNRQNNVHE